MPKLFLWPTPRHLMDFGDPQWQVSHSARPFTSIYLISFYFLGLTLPHCFFFNMPHISTLHRVPNKSTLTQ